MKNHIIPLILILLLSCGEEKRLYLQIDGNATLDECIRANDFTVLCYIDSVDCTFCSMQWLDLWTFRMEDLKKLKTGIALIVRNPDEEAVRDALSRLQLQFSVAYDKSSTVKQNNPLILNHYNVPKNLYSELR